MNTISFCCPSCRCVSVSHVDRCRAIQELVRPEEVAHLLRWYPRTRLPANSTLSTRLAHWLRSRIHGGHLMYWPDPDYCDEWCSPAVTLRRGYGDCDDFAILGASMLLAAGASCHIVTGYYCNGIECTGHAWIEGRDEGGPFLLEATSATVHRRRPAQYNAQLFLRPGRCV